jgi:hypothetical protein
MVRSLVLTVTLLALAGRAGADTEIACHPIVVPGQGLSAWQVNNDGQVATGWFDLATGLPGSAIYSIVDGTFDPLPAPPAASGYTSLNIGPSGIADDGVIVGNAYVPSSDPNVPSREQGFILVGNQYTFFDAKLGFPQTEPRGINNGVVSGMNWNEVNNSGTGFVFNPGKTSHAYKPGYTEIRPHLSGETTTLVMPQQMNSHGQLAGSVDFASFRRSAFIYDPAASPPFHLFEVAGARRTAARGINDNGTVVGFYGHNGVGVGYVRTVDANGADVIQTFHCTGIDASGGLYPESINNQGVIVGGAYDVNFNPFGFYAQWPN